MEVMEVREAEIQDLECPETTKSGLLRYISCLMDMMGDDIAAMWLYGSLAQGCFQPITSDIDLIIVVNEPLAEPAVATALQAHRYAGMPIDAVFVTVDQLAANVFPAPVEFVIKPIGEGELQRLPDGSRDFLLQKQETLENGITLCGTELNELITPIPWPELSKSLDHVFVYLVTHLINPVLPACRAAYAWKFRKLCSKEQAGEWAAEEFGVQWSSVIKTALIEYACGKTTTAIPSDAIRAFSRHCAGYIGQLRGT